MIKAGDIFYNPEIDLNGLIIIFEWRVLGTIAHIAIWNNEKLILDKVPLLNIKKQFRKYKFITNLN